MRRTTIRNRVFHGFTVLTIAAALVQVFSHRAHASLGASVNYSYTYNATPYDPQVPPTNVSHADSKSWNLSDPLPISISAPVSSGQFPGIEFSSAATSAANELTGLSQSSANAADPQVSYFGSMTLQSSFQDVVTIDASSRNIFTLVFFAKRNGFLQGDRSDNGVSSASLTINSQLGNGNLFTFTTSRQANASTPHFLENFNTFISTAVSSPSFLRGSLNLVNQMTVSSSANADGHGVSAYAQTDVSDMLDLGFLALDRNKNPLSAGQWAVFTDSGVPYHKYDIPPTPAGKGDYDGNDISSVLDYTAWKSSFGSSVGYGTGADGNGNGTIDAADYTMWRDHLGQTAGAGAASTGQVPEPAAWVLALLACMAAVGVVRPLHWPAEIFGGCRFGRLGSP